MSGFETALFALTDALHSEVTLAVRGIAIWVLAITFTWSGVAKLRRPTLAAMAMVDFGVLHRLRPRLGSALGILELLLALSLILVILPGISLPAVAGLLWIFVVLIVKSLWSGERFACFCFGDADSKLSYLTLIRTTTLAILASILVLAPPPTRVYDGAYVLQAASAVALVGTIVLSSQLPRLLLMNKDSYKLGKEVAK